ncbi:hypothetical protein QBC45DRAFT_338865, partial [Copromyces sp. CBS 386.78]
INNITNREFYTFIIYINTTGQRILVYLIFKINLIEEFLANDFEDNIRFTKSTTGFSNTKLTLNWLKYFNRYSFKLFKTFKK